MNISIIFGLILVLALLGFGIAKILSSKSKNPGSSQEKEDLHAVPAAAPDDDTDSVEEPDSPNAASEEEKNIPEKTVSVKNKRPSRDWSLPVTRNFVGRIDETEEILEKFYQGGVIITSEQRAGGMGKTALAVKLMGELASRFPDGQIFLDLRGSTVKPLPAPEAMSKVIWARYPKMKLPENEPELKSIYQSVFNGKNILLVLDDAKNADQVKPLVPPDTRSLIITSRENVSLPEFFTQTLGPLSPQEAKEMLVALAPESRILADEITKLCDFIPLALLLAGNLLATSKEITPVLYSSKLRTKRQNLEKTATGNINAPVEGAIQVSYSSLRKATSFILPKLSLFPESFNVKAEEFICQDPNNEHLNALAKRALVIHNKKTNRYQLHPMIRGFAEKNLTDASRANTSKRHATYYLTVMLAANEHLNQDGGKHFKKALNVFDLEWANIKTGYAWGEKLYLKDSDAASICCAYPDAVPGLLDLRQSTKERIQWLKIALSIARNLKDQDIEFDQLTHLGDTFLYSQQPYEAIEYYESALELVRKLNDPIREAILLDNLGLCSSATGNYRKAIEFYEQARNFFKENEDGLSERNTLSHQGNACLHLEDTRQAIRFFEQALEISEKLGDRQTESRDLDNLGKAHFKLEQYDRAIGCYEKALKIDKELGNRIAQAQIRWHISLALVELGDQEQAIKRAKTSLQILENAGHADAKKVRQQLKEWTTQIEEGEKGEKNTQNQNSDLSLPG